MVAKPSAYIETSVISYLTARLSADPDVAADQRRTRLWWEKDRHNFDLYISPLVIEELGAGDPEAAKKRLEAVAGITLLEPTAAVLDMAQKLLEKGIFPAKASNDALHLSIASAHKVQFLLTWNYRHLGNPFVRSALREFFSSPVITNPHELLEGAASEQ